MAVGADGDVNEAAQLANDLNDEGWIADAVELPASEPRATTTIYFAPSFERNANYLARRLDLDEDQVVQPAPDPLPLDAAGQSLFWKVDDPGYPINGTALVVILGTDG